jgi:hypothetical protein
MIFVLSVNSPRNSCQVRLSGTKLRSSLSGNGLQDAFERGDKERLLRLTRLDKPASSSDGNGLRPPHRI